MDTNDTESEEKDTKDDPKDHTYNNPENHIRNNPKNETHNNPEGGPEHRTYSHLSQGTKEDHTYNNIPDPTDESSPSRPGDQQKRVRRLIPNILYEDSAQHEDSSRRNSVEDDNNDDDSERRSSLARLQHAVKNSRVLLVFTTALITTVVVTAVFLTFPPKATQLQPSPPYSFPGSITVSSTTHRDCASAWLAGNRTTGVYTITPRDGERPLEVLCDMDTAGGGWTVFQRRFDGSVSFDKPYCDYRDGFGDVRGEFWLGLEAVHQIVSRETHDLRIVLGDFEGREAYADYSNFSVSSESDGYRLGLGVYYSGTAGDGFGVSQKYMMFGSEIPLDYHKGHTFKVSKPNQGWWYHRYHSSTLSNLNGVYRNVSVSIDKISGSIHWVTWSYYTPKSTCMMVRPSTFLI
ncbi:fibrinogen-like protein 1 [Branchiostoma floridae x Branchiostoma belcheri]